MIKLEQKITVTQTNNNNKKTQSICYLFFQQYNKTEHSS